MDGPSFIPSATFNGAKPGYAFGAGHLGVGYYAEGPERADPQQATRKRGREEEGGDGGDGDVDRKDANGAEGEEAGDGELRLEDLDEETIARMLEEAEKLELPEASAAGARQLLLALERRITKNQQMRVKFPDQPEKFLESEVELDKAVSDLQVLGTTPELYPQLVQLGGAASLLALLAHENTDISIGVVSLLADLTDPEAVLSDPDAKPEAAAGLVALAEAIQENQGLELLVQNLARLDESSEEDAKGVQLTAQVLQNLVEISPPLGAALVESTSILRYLLKRLRNKKFDYNKLVCSELLVVLMNSGPAAQKKLGDAQGLDGVDALLQAVAYYRRRDPASEDEEMCVENLFDALSAALLLPENQERFRKGEGFELMLRCLREKKHAAWPALRVLDFACTNNPVSCRRFVEAGGLKAFFPAFMGRGAARDRKAAGKDGRKGRRKRPKDEKDALQQHCGSIAASLALLLTDEGGGDLRSRFVGKFLEAGAEKVDRAMELFDDYSGRVARFDAGVAAAAEAAAEAGEMDAEDDEEVEERQLLRLEAGGYTQRSLAATLLAVAAESAVVADRMRAKLRQHGRSLAEVSKVVLEYIDSLGDTATADEGARQRDAIIRERLLEILPVAAPEMGADELTAEYAELDGKET